MEKQTIELPLEIWHALEMAVATLTCSSNESEQLAGNILDDYFGVCDVIDFDMEVMERYDDCVKKIDALELEKKNPQTIH